MNQPIQVKAQSVQFEFTAATARSVSLAGTFNDWQPDLTPMRPAGNGSWVKHLTLVPGSHEYCLVVDGEWRPDPRAVETVANPFGGRNSVLHVAAQVSSKPSIKVSRLLTASP